MENKNITLIQNWFNSDRRHEEYFQCVLKNDNNEYINNYILLCDDYHEGLDTLSKKTKKIMVNKKLTFADFFNISNVLAYDQIVIIANLDIYFNDTIEIVKDIITESNALALCRWDLLDNGELRLFDRNDSQDAWIFKTPIDTGKINANFSMGIPGCDNRIAFELKKIRSIFGGGRKIQAIHHHRVKHWNYNDSKDRIPRSEGYHILEWLS